MDRLTYNREAHPAVIQKDSAPGELGVPFEESPRSEGPAKARTWPAVVRTRGRQVRHWNTTAVEQAGEVKGALPRGRSRSTARRAPDAGAIIFQLYD